QASLATLIVNIASATLPNDEKGLLVMLIIGIPRRHKSGSSVTISMELPEYEMAITMSSLVIVPKSPWLASPGWTKKDGEPVLARVAAIFFAIWPDFPMPVTMVRPRQLSIIVQALTNS